MKKDFKIFSLAFVLFFAALVIDVSVAPKIPWGVYTIIYWLIVYGCWLVFFPIYMSMRWTMRDGLKLLGVSLAFWSIEDTLYYFIHGYSVFAPFLGRPGFYPLLVNWYPVWFLILSRLVLGFCVIMYISAHSQWGEHPLVCPSITRDEVMWILRIVAVVCVGIVIFGAWYSHYSRADFGGKIVYEVSLKYKAESCPEAIFRGLLVKVWDENIHEVRYALIRQQMNLSNFGIAWVKESQLLDRYLGKDVEILGKLVYDPRGRILYKYYSRKDLLPGRIRETREND